MTLKFQLNVDVSDITPTQLASIVEHLGRDLLNQLKTQSPPNSPAIMARYQAAPVFNRSEYPVGNWRIITS